MFTIVPVFTKISLYTVGGVQMFILFFAVWVLLNGKINWEVATFGAVISALLYLFCCRFMHYSPKRDMYNFKRLPKLFAFFLTVVGEIFRSAFALLPYIYSHKEPDPVVAGFKTERVKTETGRVLLANAITTPSTPTACSTPRTRPWSSCCATRSRS